MSWEAWHDEDTDVEDMHVVPSFGPKHVMSATCWCRPDHIDDDGTHVADDIWVHKVRQ